MWAVVRLAGWTGRWVMIVMASWAGRSLGHDRQLVHEVVFAGLIRRSLLSRLPMAFSDHLLDIGTTSSSNRTSASSANWPTGVTRWSAARSRHWVKRLPRPQDYARKFALAGATAGDESTMTHLLGVAHQVLDTEMDLHREFASDYGISERELESTEKAPTCLAYTNFLVGRPTRDMRPRLPRRCTPVCRATSTWPNTWPTWPTANTGTRPYRDVHQRRLPRGDGLVSSVRRPLWRALFRPARRQGRRVPIRAAKTVPLPVLTRGTQEGCRRPRRLRAPKSQ